VLTVIELLRQLMERQALHRIEAGSLSAEEIERLGRTLVALADRMEELKVAQERLYEILMERASTERCPSHQLLDRIEATLWTTEQVVGYVNMLNEKIDET
jgi:hypothetical protein